MSSAKLFITIVIVNNPEDTDNGGNKKELTVVERFLGARHCTKCFTCVFSCYIGLPQWGGEEYYYPYFTDEETEAQRV